MVAIPDAGDTKVDLPIVFEARELRGLLKIFLNRCNVIVRAFTEVIKMAIVLRSLFCGVFTTRLACRVSTRNSLRSKFLCEPCAQYHRTLKYLLAAMFS